jgi:hypothetical protein
MNDTLRHLLIFIVIISTGTVLIFYDQTLLFIMALEAMIGFLFLVLFSPGFGAELKSSVQDLHKISFIRRYKNNKPSFKMAEPKKIPAKKQEPLFVKEKDTGFNLDLHSFISSVKALGKSLSTRKKGDKKKSSEIDRLPDTTVSKNGDVSALALAGELSDDAGMPGKGTGGGQGTKSASPQSVEDPFLSLSSDELESGLLDAYDEEEREKTPIEPEIPVPSPDSQPIMDATSGLTIGEADIPTPPQDVSIEHQDSLNTTEPDLEEFDDLEGSDAIDQNLGELEDIGTGDLEPEEEVANNVPETGTPATPPPLESLDQAPETNETPVQPGPAGSPTFAVPAPDQRPAEQSDMTIFTTPTSADDEMVKSLASETKTAKKSKDASLLRELKDFNAPAKDIEGELNEIFSEMNTAEKKNSKVKPS